MTKLIHELTTALFVFVFFSPGNAQLLPPEPVFQLTPHMTDRDLIGKKTLSLSATQQSLIKLTPLSLEKLQINHVGEKYGWMAEVNTWGYHVSRYSSAKIRFALALGHNWVSGIEYFQKFYRLGESFTWSRPAPAVFAFGEINKLFRTYINVSTYRQQVGMLFRLSPDFSVSCSGTFEGSERKARMRLGYVPDSMISLIAGVGFPAPNPELMIFVGKSRWNIGIGSLTDKYLGTQFLGKVIYRRRPG